MTHNEAHGQRESIDQLDPDAEVSRVVTVARVGLELLRALLQEPGQLLPQRRRRQRPLHIPHPPSKQSNGGGRGVISRSIIGAQNTGTKMQGDEREGGSGGRAVAPYRSHGRSGSDPE